MAFVTGIDLLEIRRMERSIQSPRFLQRCFGSEELRQFEAAGRKPSFLAGNFCAKEAFSKALGTGVRGFFLHEVAAIRDPLGAPFLVFSGRAKELVEQRGLAFSLSISHTREYAVAIVVAWKKNETSK